MFQTCYRLNGSHLVKLRESSRDIIVNESFPSWIHCSMIYIVHSVDSVVAHVSCIVLQLY